MSMKATNTTIYLTGDENEKIANILEANPFLKKNKSAAIRYALFYWSEAPKCPVCHTLLTDMGRGLWQCFGKSHP